MFNISMFRLASFFNNSIGHRMRTKLRLTAKRMDNNLKRSSGGRLECFNRCPLGEGCLGRVHRATMCHSNGRGLMESKHDHQMGSALPRAVDNNIRYATHIRTTTRQAGGWTVRPIIGGLLAQKPVIDNNLLHRLFIR